MADPLITDDVSVLTFPNGDSEAFNLQNQNISLLLHSNMSAENVSMLGCFVDNVEVDSGYFANCTFQNATFKNSVFRNCSFRNCWFDCGRLENVLFDNCEIDESMRGVEFLGVMFHRSVLNLNFSDSALERIYLSNLNLEGIELQSRLIGTVELVNCIGNPVFLDLHTSRTDFDAFRAAGWMPSGHVDFENQCRQDLKNQIDQEFGDDVEKWYQKWIAGFLE